MDLVTSSGSLLCVTTAINTCDDEYLPLRFVRYFALLCPLVIVAHVHNQWSLSTVNSLEYGATGLDSIETHYSNKPRLWLAELGLLSTIEWNASQSPEKLSTPSD